MTRWTIELVQEFARGRGIECVSDRYVNNKVKMWWRCAAGHEWEAPLNNVANKGSGCPECLRAEKLAEYAGFAAGHGGFLVSTEWLGYDVKHEWECVEGHRWETTPTLVRKGHWCPECASRAFDLQKFVDIARERGGVCLSDEYVNCKSKVRMRCAAGHEWDARGESLARGSWCPICGRGTLILEDMRVMAADRGGECLSTEYVNTKTLMSWRCAAGHEWEARAKNIRAGHWCPVCAVDERKKTLKSHRKCVKVLFGGGKFPFFAVDFINLVASASNYGEGVGRRITAVAVRDKLVRFMKKWKSYRAMWFTNNPYTYNILPDDWEGHSEGDFDCKYLETSQKWDSELNRPKNADIDAMLTGLATAFLNEHRQQISAVYLCSGDIDLKVVGIVAKRLDLPFRVIAAYPGSLSRELGDMAGNVWYLYK